MENNNETTEPDPLYLTTEESQLLHRVACRLVESETRSERTSVSDYTLGRLASWPLVGVFVTLRHDKKLRACIGNFAESTPLADALERAAVGVVSHDPRFDRVTSDELPKLTLSVSLLHTREQISGNAQGRATSIEIGQHGLDIQFAGRKGLLLPSVATDFKLDPVGFLETVCRKAGLDDNAWQNPDTTLYRFSSITFGGPWTKAAAAS